MQFLSETWAHRRRLFYEETPSRHHAGAEASFHVSVPNSDQASRFAPTTYGQPRRYAPEYSSARAEPF